MRNRIGHLNHLPERDDTRQEGFWSRLGQFLRRTPAAEADDPVYVKVWDAYRDTYRRVDLRDRNDPLWHAANNINMMQSIAGEAPRSAA